MYIPNDYLLNLPVKITKIGQRMREVRELTFLDHSICYTEQAAFCHMLTYSIDWQDISEYL